MDVRLVVLHATASDANGNIISGLDGSAFRLFVDDQPHPITDFQGEDTPVAVEIVMDQSSGMAGMRTLYASQDHSGNFVRYRSSQSSIDVDPFRKDDFETFRLELSKR